MVKPPAKMVNVWRGVALAGALLLVNSLHADVVAWWRFDTIGADGKVVNAAKAAVRTAAASTVAVTARAAASARATRLPRRLSTTSRRPSTRSSRIRRS